MPEQTACLPSYSQTKKITPKKTYGENGKHRSLMIRRFVKNNESAYENKIAFVNKLFNGKHKFDLILKIYM